MYQGPYSRKSYDNSYLNFVSICKLAANLHKLFSKQSRTFIAKTFHKGIMKQFYDKFWYAPFYLLVADINNL